MSMMADGGVEQLFTTACGPLVRWRPPVLEVAHRHDEDIHLNGRGLVIAPTMFSTPQIQLLSPPLDPDRAPTLAVPSLSGTSLDTVLWEGVGQPTAQSLDDLLGRTRAAVLRTAVGGCSKVSTFFAGSSRVLVSDPVPPLVGRESRPLGWRVRRAVGRERKEGKLLLRMHSVSYRPMVMSMSALP
nr:hypothetical protein [Streptomyces antibioticus]